MVRERLRINFYPMGGSPESRRASKIGKTGIGAEKERDFPRKAWAPRTMEGREKGKGVPGLRPEKEAGTANTENQPSKYERNHTSGAQNKYPVKN